jgi:hypothetical protein
VEIEIYGNKEIIGNVESERDNTSISTTFPLLSFLISSLVSIQFVTSFLNPLKTVENGFVRSESGIASSDSPNT